MDEKDVLRLKQRMDARADEKKAFDESCADILAKRLELSQIQTPMQKFIADFDEFGTPPPPPTRMSKLLGLLARIVALPAKPFVAVAAWLEKKRRPSRVATKDDLNKALTQVFRKEPFPDGYLSMMLDAIEHTKPGRLVVVKGETTEQAIRRVIKTKSEEYSRRERSIDRTSAMEDGEAGKPVFMQDEPPSGCLFNGKDFLESIILTQLYSHQTKPSTCPISAPKNVDDPVLAKAKELRLRELLAKNELDKEEKAQLDDLTKDGVVVLEGN